MSAATTTADAIVTATATATAANKTWMAVLSL